jgi:hypothetical protein
LQTYLYGLTLELTPITIVNDNKLSWRITYQPGVMKQIFGWMLSTYYWLQQFQTILYFVSGSIILIKNRECVLDSFLIVNKNECHIYTDHDPGIQCLILLFLVTTASKSYFLHFRSLFVIWHTWQLEHQQWMFNF